MHCSRFLFVAGLVSARFRGGFRGGRDRLDFGDLNSELGRAFHQMLPSKRPRPLGRELIVERHGIMVVQQNEMIAERM